jgi:hypothetical protein
MTGAPVPGRLVSVCWRFRYMPVLTNLLLSNGTAKSRRTWPFGTSCVVRDVSRLTGTNSRQQFGDISRFVRSVAVRVKN